MRRRCLIFEVASVSKRNMYSDSKLNPLTSLSFKGKSVCDTKNLKPKIRESLYALPGIGLHLNALATTSKDRMVNKETLASEKQIISIPCSVGSLTSTTAGRNSLSKSSSAVEKDLCPSGSEVDLQIVSDDAPKDVTPNICEELSQGSPKKKRLSVELPFSSIASSTTSTKLSIGRSPAVYGSHMLRKCEMVLPPPKLENNVSTVVEDDTPAILRPTAAPTTTGIRIASPNQKRVSPPHGGAVKVAGN
ncbi:hypothetical protein GW17_00004291 [Ensete ventricosum]|nr:hypothetical protein GW17_00004291 [Ensete ventricosum]RZR95281.1 hypothetical protein BHM03_00024104 [Ensete ventricosum]